MFWEKDKAFMIGLLIALFSGLIHLIALLLPWWAYVESDFFGDTWQTNFGLWDRCKREIRYNGEEDNVCVAESDDYAHRTRTTQTFALILLGVGTLAVCAQKCFHTEFVLVSMIGAILVLASGFVSWIGLLTYADAFPATAVGHTPGDLHAGFWLAWMADLLIFTSGLLFTYRRIKGY